MRKVALTHHLPHEHDRCVRVGSKLVCRRCFVLYPVAFAFMFAALAGAGWSASLDPLLLLVLPAPVAIEYVAEQVGGLSYNARRQQLLTLLAAPALGTGLARHIRTPFTKWFVAMVLLHGGICALAHVVASSRRGRREQSERQLIAASDPVLTGFESAEAFRSYLDDVSSRSSAH
jgi:hypothetical protein